jgi:hypothetical protein
LPAILTGLPCREIRPAELQELAMMVETPGVAPFREHHQRDIGADARSRSKLASAGRGGTLFVDFHTTKPDLPRGATSTPWWPPQKWKESAAFLLDGHPGVKKRVKTTASPFSFPIATKVFSPLYAGFHRGYGFQS